MSPDPSSPKRSFTNLARNSSLVECPQLKIVRIDGSLFFGAVNHVIRVLQSIKQKHLLIVSSGINFIDVAGAEMLAQEAKRRRSLQGNMYLTKVKMRAHDMFERGGYLHEIKAENIFNSKDVAIHSILSQLDQEVCAQCTARIFLECPKKLDK
jgi:SulP family sulfate permease